MTQPSAPPQLSPDGHWWWTGTEWVPAAQQPTPEQAPEPVETVPAQSTPEWAVQAYAAPTPQAYSAPGYAAPTYGTQVYAPAPSGTDALAITSLVTSLLWLGGAGSVAGIITGHMSRSKARREGREPSGMALAGLILGYIGATFIVVCILAAIAIPVFLNQRVTGEQATLRSSLRNMAIAEEAYFTEHATYTPDPGALRATGFSPDPTVEVAVLRASSNSYCLGAHKGTQTLYFDGITFTKTACA
jgi:Tfp pilus assembly protein PilE